MAIVALAVAVLQLSAAESASPRPNILWIVVEDMSSHFGYQGEGLVSTPHVDALAKEGVVFSNAYVTAPVCSAARSAMVTGMYQTSIGAQHHRSSRGTLKIELPSYVKLIPQLFREAGYYVCNVNETLAKNGKTDYNFAFDQKTLYDDPDWAKRKEGQPFFAQVQLRGGKLRNVPKWLAEVEAGLDERVRADQVSLPPYYPDAAVFREDWASYLNSVQYTDKEVGAIIDRLRREGDWDNTVIFFMTDHGISQARGKQFVYDEGAKIPFVVWAPELLKGGVVRDEPIAHIDMTATSLFFAGIQIPDYLQGHPLFGEEAKPREYVVIARDRCDETVDRIRGLRKGHFKYIRNFYPQRPYLQPCVYKDHKPWMAIYKGLHAEGKLDAVQSLHLASVRPDEELYDLSSDRWEVRNLAGEAEYQETLREMRGLLADWIIETDDQGRFPESEAMYDSDMKAYVVKVKDPSITKNIATMKRWRSEGK